VRGTEWLAFEPEYALMFARPRRRGHPYDAGGGGQRLPLGRRKREQKLLHEGVADENDEQAGFLHTYVAAKNLRLIYLDGLSAAKTDMGTLDSQDRILFRDNITGPGFQEYERAELACQIARDDWGGRIDGILRMECGFEIILCDFERDLNLVRINQVRGRDEGDGGRPRGPGQSISTYKAIAARFNGIGGGRVRVNYEHFVTAYAYKGLDLFQGDKSENALPRLSNFSLDELEPIRRDLDQLVLDHDAEESLSSFNWQSITDMIVERYSNELKYLVSDDISSLETLHSEIETILLPFIDYRLRNATAEAYRCATQFIPANNNSATARMDTLAARAVYDIAYTICATLRSALDEEDDQRAAVDNIEQLVEYLAWTTWHECPRKCGHNEVCYIPIWPFGTVEDREHPQCRDKPSSDGERYWSGRGGPCGRSLKDAFDKHYDDEL
jgi:hypothetical protein